MATVQKAAPLAVILLASTFTGPAPAQEKGTKDSAALKWAHEIAEQFLQAVVDNKPPAALACMTPEFQKHVGGDPGFVLYFRFQLESGAVTEETALAGWTFAGEGVAAPDQDEVRLAGVLKGPKRQARFSMTVEKDAKTGKWRVNSFTYADRR
jgi:hypothetical protein